MQFEEMLKKEHMKGQSEGEQRMFELVSKMIADGKAEQVKRLKNETEFCEEMLKEYRL